MTSEDSPIESPTKTYEDGLTDGAKRRDDQLLRGFAVLIVSALIVVIVSICVNWVAGREEKQSDRLDELELVVYQLCDAADFVIEDADMAHDRVDNLYDAVPTAIEPSDEDVVTTTTFPTTTSTTSTTMPDNNQGNIVPPVETTTSTIYKETQPTYYIPPRPMRPSAPVDLITLTCEQLPGYERSWNN